MGFRRRLKLLKRSSTSILVRTVYSTLLKTTGVHSVNCRFPSATNRFGGVSDGVLLTRAISLVTTGKCGMNGISTAVYTRHPGLGTQVPRVRLMLTRLVKVSISSISMGTAAARGLKFANERRNVSTCTAMLVRGTR